jgi:hypothetical protein
MADAHPTEFELLQYVEGELTRAERGRVEAHVGSCSACAAAIAEAEAGRDALRASVLLEPPRELRGRISADLARHEPPRRVYVSPMRLVALLAPFAVVLALVSAIAALDLGGGGDDGAGGGAGVAAEGDEGGGGDAAGGGGAAPESGAGSTTSLAGPVASVAGPPRAVAEHLRARGFDARVDGGRVIVTGATPRAVVRAVAARPDGPVVVVVRP